MYITISIRLEQNRTEGQTEAEEQKSRKQKKEMKSFVLYVVNHRSVVFIHFN